MVVCICKSLNDNSIRLLIKEYGIRKVKQIQQLGVCDQCKKCCSEVKKIIKEVHE